MALFGLTHEWSFPSNNNGQIYGIADGGVETFIGTPYKSLAREICQNSLDANLHNGKPTRIEFKRFEIEPKQIPGFPGLQDAFQRSLDFWSLQKSDRTKAFFREAIRLGKQEKISCLRISDFNTTGLTGSNDEENYNSPWSNLTKSSGASDKSGTNGGSFGIGKFAPFACSAFRTVFYSTADKEGVCSYQGVARLTSFKDKSKEITQGTGYYGNKKNTPVHTQISLDPNFKRDSKISGTDIFVLGFKEDADWQRQIIASILDGFLYAIYIGNMIVDVDGIEISKKTLPDLMVKYKKDFKEHADEYYQALVDEKLARRFEKEITDDPELKGKLTLKLMIMPEFHRRAAMVRQTGMKIKDKGNISGLIPFAGVLYIEGEELNTYLRSLENPQHLEWEIGRAANKAKASRLLNDLTKFIKESLKELQNDDSEEALDPSVGEYLSAPQEDDMQNQDSVESVQDTIRDIKVKITEIKPQPSGTQDGEEGSTAVDDPNGDIIETDVPGEGGSGGKNPGHGGGGGGGDNPGNGGGNEPTEHKKSLSSIAPVSVRNLVRNKSTGEYTIVFTPKVSASDGHLEIFMAAESQNYEAAIISASSKDMPNLPVSKNKVTNLTFTAGQPIRIDIKLDYSDYCSLEVKAYGNKV